MIPTADCHRLSVEKLEAPRMGRVRGNPAQTPRCDDSPLQSWGFCTSGAAILLRSRTPAGQVGEVAPCPRWVVSEKRVTRQASTAAWCKTRLPWLAVRSPGPNWRGVAPSGDARNLPSGTAGLAFSRSAFTIGRCLYQRLNLLPLWHKHAERQAEGAR